MLQTARVLGLGPEELRRVMYELPSSAGQRQRHVDPCPLSGRELGVLQRLAEGKVYKQIAHELTLSTSTVRTHLHNIYGKLGAVDRAQACSDRHRARLALSTTSLVRPLLHGRCVASRMR